MKFFRIAAVVLILFAAVIIFALPNNSFRTKTSKNQQLSTSIPAIYPYPVAKETKEPAPTVTAKSVVVTDAKSGLSLYEKDPNARLLPASVTKLMTAIVALEKCSLNDVVTVSHVQNDPNRMGLETGDKVSIKSLLKGLLIVSGNDAAFTLSYSCANSTSDFVEEMNKKSLELGMKNTHFTNPAGFDNPAHFSTSKDLARLGKIAVSNPIISEIVSTKNAVVTDIFGTKTYFLDNTNELLEEIKGVEGIKTGQTEGSKEVLLTKTTRDGNTIIVIVLGSQDRFKESKELIEWAFKNFLWVEP